MCSSETVYRLDVGLRGLLPARRRLIGAAPATRWLTARARHGAILRQHPSMMQLFKRKPIADLVPEGEHALKRVLGAGDLVMLAIGAVIGAGIFGAIGTAAAGQVAAERQVIRYAAGPALVFSFLLLGGACALAALCYAELAAMIPQAGSAYAYSYATLGEFVAWIIGWDLVLEYAVGNVAVAISWGDYFTTLLRGVGVDAAGVADDRLSHRAAELESRRAAACCDRRRTSPACRSWSTCRRSGS